MMLWSNLCSYVALLPWITKAWRLEPVNTTNGLVIGHQIEGKDNVRVREWLGIPYAKPPVGQLRFAAPKPFVSDRGAVFVADQYVCTDSILCCRPDMAEHCHGLMLTQGYLVGVSGSAPSIFR